MNTEKGTAPTGEGLPQPPPLPRKIRRQLEREAEKNRPRATCPFPGCGSIFVIDKEKPNACPRHRELIGDVVFIMNRVAGKPDVQEEAEAKGPATEKGPAFYVPKPGMSNQAIKEAVEAAKGKGVQRP